MGKRLLIQAELYPLKLYIEVLSPGPQNVTVFRDWGGGEEVFKEAIKFNEVIKIAPNSIELVSL